MRVGIFGGTFNPPHCGHVLLAEHAVRALMLDLLYIIPAADPPHKEVAQKVPAEHRLAMARLAFEGVERAQVSDLEIRRGGKSYTADTAEELLRLHPGAQLYLLVGTDMLMNLPEWRRVEELLKLCTIAAFQRETGDGEKLEAQARYLRERFGARVEIIRDSFLEVSSTWARERLREGESRELPKKVVDYIRKNKLYL